MSCAVLDLGKAVAIWSECRKIQLKEYVGLVGGTFSIWFSLKGYAKGQGYPW